MRKRTNLFIVDGDTSVANKLEDYIYDHPEIGLNILKKKTTKNGFINGKGNNSQEMKRLWMTTDIFIFFASLADGSSIELIETLKANESLQHKKIIFLVDNQTKHYINLARQNGVDAILMKPFKIKDLLTTIHRIKES